MRKIQKAFASSVKSTVGSKIEVLVPKECTRLIGFSVSAKEKVELTLERDADTRFLQKAEFCGRELDAGHSNGNDQKLSKRGFHSMEQAVKPGTTIRGVIKGVKHAFDAAVDAGRLTAPQIFVTVLFLYDNE